MQAGSQAGENGSSGALLNCCGVEVRGAEKLLCWRPKHHSVLVYGNAEVQ